MTSETSDKTEKSRPGPKPLTRITVSGFKSIRDKTSIEVRPLTVLAGANSSGKSSIMQPLLLLKQTLEAPYDPGPLLLNGPNVAFTQVEQLLTRCEGKAPGDEFSVGMDFGPNNNVFLWFRESDDSGFDLCRSSVRDGATHDILLSPDMAPEEIWGELPEAIRKGTELVVGGGAGTSAKELWAVYREKCFLIAACMTNIAKEHSKDKSFPFIPLAVRYAETSLLNLLHIPALREHPKRADPVTAVGKYFPGLFDVYVASVIAKWQTDGNKKAINGVNRDLSRLGLTRQVIAKRVSDAAVELHVARLPQSDTKTEQDYVSIADVGFGVSQVLPVIVALHVAGPENLVYIEQPEIHLHPRAQVAMAEVLADAVKRGVRMVIETHSQLLLTALQTAVAEGVLPKEDVKLHWFTRSEEDGSSDISSADLDEAGAFGDWPVDFGDVELEADNKYLNAADARMRNPAHGQ